MKTTLSSLAVFGTLVIGASSAAAAELPAFNGDNLLHRDQMFRGPEAEELATLGLAVTNSSNAVDIKSLTCSVALDSSVDCSMIVGGQVYAKSIKGAAGSAVADLVKIVVQKTGKSSIQRDAQGQEISATSYPVKVSCWPMNGCTIFADVGYKLDAYSVDSNKVPGINQLLDKLPASFNVAGPEAPVAVFVIDSYTFNHEGGNPKRGGGTYPERSYTGITSGKNHVVIYEDQSLGETFAAIKAAQVVQGLPYDARSSVITCTRPATGDSKLATCAVVNSAH